MNLQPTLSRIIIRPDTEIDSKKIIIPDAVKKHGNTGEVLAVGPGRRHIDGNVYKSSLKEGDKVMFNPSQAMPFVHEGMNVVVCEDENVLMVIG